MKAGKLRHLATVQRLVTTQDTSSGAVVEAWVDVCQAWASVEALNGREFVAAQAIQASVNTRITIRMPAQGLLDASMRVLVYGVPYNIRAVLPDPTRTEQLVLWCDVGANDG